MLNHLCFVQYVKFSRPQSTYYDLVCYYGRMNHASTCALLHEKFLALEQSGAAQCLTFPGQVFTQDTVCPLHHCVLGPFNLVLSRLAFTSCCCGCPVSNHTLSNGNFMPVLGRTHPTGVCYGRCRIRANSCLSLRVMTGRFASASQLGWVHGRVEGALRLICPSVCLGLSKHFSLSERHELSHKLYTDQMCMERKFERFSKGQSKIVESPLTKAEWLLKKLWNIFLLFPLEVDADVFYTRCHSFLLQKSHRCHVKAHTDRFV